MRGGKVGIGFVGVGCISAVYLKNITEMFREIEVVGVCDLIEERARKASEQYGVRVYRDMYELFEDPAVDIVLNITRPYEHYEVTKAALLAGKNVYSEKPLAPRLEEGRELVALAKEKGLMLGGAPDTFLGAGIQTCRRLIDDGVIGRPVGAAARFASHGAETWHPDCEFLYRYGGGPMLDMGPYYVTAMVNLMGRVKSVCGYAKTTFDKRTMLCGPKCGEEIPVSVPTWVMGNLMFENGAVAALFTTFDVYSDAGVAFEIYGTKGTIKVPDPNFFGGPVLLMRGEDQDKDGGRRFCEIPLMYRYTGNSRALGLADMAKALTTGRPHRANSMQQLHVLEVMEGLASSGEDGAVKVMETPFVRQAPMDEEAVPGILD